MQDDRYDFNFSTEIKLQGLDKILAGKVYLGNDKEPLNLKCEDDCKKYYKHIVYLVSSVNGRKIIRLSREPASSQD